MSGDFSRSSTRYGHLFDQEEKPGQIFCGDTKGDYRDIAKAEGKGKAKAQTRRELFPGRGRLNVKHVPEPSAVPGVVMCNAKAMNTTAAKELSPERLKFPGEPAFDPSPVFNAETAAVYEDPIKHGRKVLDTAEPPPRVQVRATRENLFALYKKLTESGRLQVVPPSMVRHGYLNCLQLGKMQPVIG
eukprot:s533_g3.t1